MAVTCTFICGITAVSPGIGTASLDAAEQKSQATVGIVWPAASASPVRIAARELAAGLSGLYRSEVFGVFEGQAPAEARMVIHVGTRASLPGLAEPFAGRLQAPESYVVTTVDVDGRSEGLLVGSDARGVMYGTHGLLQKLGYGYYLGVETSPPPRRGSFDYDDWDLSDRPLVPTRAIFNWHNFLTSCSTWNLEHWLRWISRSQRMGFNTIIVHAYGNNPMAGFRFRGVDRPVGYLSSTRLGRSWFVNHVNDARRLHGGEVFREPVFGSSAAAEGTDRERTAAAQRLMHEVFEHAEQRGVNVIFAFDIDTRPGNPQELITLLDESERFRSGGHWLPNPDTPGGYAFYKSQVAGLLQAYPRIDTLALWHRTGGTPWMGYRHDDMPESWQRQLDAACKEKPGTDKLWHARHMFGMAKVAAACQNALHELGREDVSIAFGSWQYSFLAAADRFLPAGVTLIPLDWMVLVDKSQLSDAESRAVIGKVAEHRPVLPVVWAQHDDGAHVMRPFKPFANFQDRLEDARCAAYGYGILHWMTRPLDLYFASLGRQTWCRTRNESFAKTCRRAAEDWFGPAQGATIGRYLERWVNEAPMFARETSDWFVDRPLGEPGPIADRMEERIQPLLSIDATSLRPGARERLEYFKGVERFVVDAHRLERDFRKAHQAIERGSLDEAREVAALIAGAPQRIIRELAESLQRGSITRGEQGLIVTLNTRWLPHYVRLRQRLGLEVIRYNFGPTVHDPIAPRPGRFTFHFDSRKRIWQTLGEKETGARVFSFARGEKLDLGTDAPRGADEIARQGLRIDKPLTIPLRPIMIQAYGRRDVRPSPRLLAGPYRVTTWTILPVGRGELAFHLIVACGKKILTQSARQFRIENDDPPALSRLDDLVTLTEAGEVTLTVKPIDGEVLLSAVVIEPVRPTK